jgi:hypothetical protein
MLAPALLHSGRGGGSAPTTDAASRGPTDIVQVSHDVGPVRTRGAEKAREMRQTAQERTDRGDSDRPNVTSEGDLVARIFPAGAFPKLSRQAART